MKALRYKKIKSQQGGLATLEALPILIVFLILITYGLGFFGAVHTSILYSIHARTYAFETLRNRTNYTYFRDTGSGGSNFRAAGFRLHGIGSSENLDNNGGFIVSSTRPITFGRTVERKSASDQTVHNEQIYNIRQRNRQGGVEVNPIWIMVQYGICVTASCGE